MKLSIVTLALGLLASASADQGALRGLQTGLQCDMDPVPGHDDIQEACAIANEKTDDGYEYIYNAHRGTDDAECGDLECWCCRHASNTRKN